MSKTMFFFAATLFGGLLQAQTLNLLQGNGQLQPDFEYQGGTPIVFKVTASTDSNTPGLPGQVITITATPYGSTMPVAPPLTATTLVTGADGTVAVNFLPPVIGYGSNVSYNQYEFTASLATQGTLPYIFFETGYATDTPSDPTTPQAAAQLVSPTNLRSVTYTGQAGISGTPVQISVFVAAGPQSGQSIGDVTITPVLIPPFGTGATVQSVRCKEAYSLDYEGSVYTTFVANSIATCTPIFTLPNAVFPPGTNNFQFEILVGDNFVYGPITYNITVAPVTLSGGLINAEAPYPATPVGGHRRVCSVYVHHCRRSTTGRRDFERANRDRERHTHCASRRLRLHRESRGRYRYHSESRSVDRRFHRYCRYSYADSFRLRG